MINPGILIKELKFLEILKVNWILFDIRYFIFLKIIINL